MSCYNITVLVDGPFYSYIALAAQLSIGPGISVGLGLPAEKRQKMVKICLILAFKTLFLSPVKSIL